MKRVYTLRDTRSDQYKSISSWTIDSNKARIWKAINHLKSHITRVLKDCFLRNDELCSKFPNTEVVIYDLVEVGTLPIEEFYFFNKSGV